MPRFFHRASRDVRIEVEAGRDGRWRFEVYRVPPPGKGREVLLVSPVHAGAPSAASALARARAALGALGADPGVPAEIAGGEPR